MKLLLPIYQTIDTIISRPSHIFGLRPLTYRFVNFPLSYIKKPSEKFIHCVFTAFIVFIFGNNSY